MFGKSIKYLVLIVVFLVGYFIVDSMSLARFIGTSAARLTDSFYLICLLFGGYIAFKFDAFVASLIVAFVSALLSFSATSEWQTELGIYDGAFALISSTTLFGILIPFFIYSLMVVIFSKGKR
jgi:hypothetical protein